jgi:hypothetical protein
MNLATEYADGEYKVFINYSHDSENHQQVVLNLAD